MAICGNCFNNIPDQGLCPICGYDNSLDGKIPIALLPGTVLNQRFFVGRVLGQGGFGITYLAQDYATKERVAIKEYFPTEFVSRSLGTRQVQFHRNETRESFETGKQQFLAEARTLAEFIGDEHIVRIYRYFEENDTAYFAMEYVQGKALNKYIEDRKQLLTVDEANDIFLPLMESLGNVHAKGIVHRDLSPDNIIIQPDGSGKIIDFGAARYSTGEMSKSLDVVLKHGFAPPEQYTRRGRQGPFTDVYALAATYYFAVTGKVPPDAVDRMVDDTLVPPSRQNPKISKKIDPVISKALAPSYKDRYQSMTEFSDALITACSTRKPTAEVPNEAAYREACRLQETSKTEAEYKAAAKKFEKLGSYKDSKARITQCGDAVTALKEQQRLAKTKKQAAAKPEQGSAADTGTKKGMPAWLKIAIPVLLAAAILTVVFLTRKPAEAPQSAPVPDTSIPVAAGTEQPTSSDGEESPATAAAFMGVTIDSKYNHAYADYYKMPYGAYVSDEDGAVIPGSAGDKAGLQSKDVITALGEYRIESYEDLKEALTHFHAYETTVMTVYRGEEYLDLTIIFDEAPAQDEEASDPDATDNIVIFGSYEQDNNLENGPEPIEWIVLDVQDGKSLLISRYGIDFHLYNSEYVYISWENCTLRGWLNDTFLNEAFSEEEQAVIQTVTVTADKNPRFDADPGNDTQDQIFLLSVPEAEQYFDSDEARICQPTAYAKNHGNDADYWSGSWWWWLRTPGGDSSNAAYVDIDGSVEAGGGRVDTDFGTVRPALWVDTEAIQYVYPLNTEAGHRAARTVGNIVTFGIYEQDNDLENGREFIEWIVLDVQGDRSLLISRYGLDNQRYHSDLQDITWENCGLRTWLNKTFLKTAFRGNEQGIIATATVSADENPDYSTDPGKDTQDRIFLLSIPEAEQYFGSDEARACQATEYAKAQGSHVSEKYGSCQWWLRSPGELSDHAAYVLYVGSVSASGSEVYVDNLTVRPALWIDTSKLP